MNTKAATKAITMTLAPRLDPRATPERLLVWFREQQARGSVLRYEVQLRSAMGAAQIVDDLDPTDVDADELAGKAWRMALEDSESSPEIGSVNYAVIAYRADGAGGARCGFRVPPPSKNDLGAIEPSNGQGVVAMSMRHLSTQLQGAHTLMAEGLESVFEGHAQQMLSAAKLVEGWQKLAIETGESARKALDHSASLIEKLATHNERLIDRNLEQMAMHEDLASAKGERDLKLARAHRSDTRIDKTVGMLATTFLPAIAARLKLSGLELGGAKGTAEPAALDAAKKPDDGGEPLPSFSPPALRAIGRFLEALQHRDVIAIRDALEGECQARFDGVVEQLVKSAEAKEEEASPS